jgi:hypothetical protein
MKVGTADWPDGIVRAWVYWRTLLLLGFAPEHVLVGVGEADVASKSIILGAPPTVRRRVVVVQVVSPLRKKAMNISADIWEDDDQAFGRLWSSFTSMLDQQECQVDLKRAWDATVKSLQKSPSMRIDALAIALVNNGIDVPLFQY